MTRSGSFDVLRSQRIELSQWTEAWMSGRVVELQAAGSVIRAKIVAVEPATDESGAEVSGMWTISWEAVT